MRSSIEDQTICAHFNEDKYLRLESFITKYAIPMLGCAHTTILAYVCSNAIDPSARIAKILGQQTICNPES